LLGASGEDASAFWGAARVGSARAGCGERGSDGDGEPAATDGVDRRDELDARCDGEAPPTARAREGSDRVEQSPRRPLVGASGANQGPRNSVADVVFVQQREAVTGAGGAARSTPTPRELGSAMNCGAA
jgi:hypothetical protein